MERDREREEGVEGERGRARKAMCVCVCLCVCLFVCVEESAGSNASLIETGDGGLSYDMAGTWQV